MFALVFMLVYDRDIIIIYVCMSACLNGINVSLVLGLFFRVSPCYITV